MSRIALIGFGEVGQILARDLLAAGVTEVAAWDIAFDRPDSIPGRAIHAHPVRAASSAADAAHGAHLVISAVTAAQALAAASSVGVLDGACFLDLNSCSPATKIASADAVQRARGLYVEAAVMGPVPPTGMATPMLLGGAYAEAFEPGLRALGFIGAEVFSETLGQAAAAKLCRSVVIKGVEALLTESLITARRYGVERVVLESLSDLLPLPDWAATSTYMISRSVEHGARRAEEMREAARTVAEAGVEPLMSGAIAERQAWAGGRVAPVPGRLADLLDAINQTSGEPTR